MSEVHYAEWASTPGVGLVGSTAAKRSMMLFCNNVIVIYIYNSKTCLLGYARKLWDSRLQPSAEAETNKDVHDFYTMQRIFQRHRDLSHQNNWQPRHNQCTADCCSYCISGWWSGTKEYIILHNISYTRVLPLHYAEADFVWRRWRQMCLCACLVFNPVRDDDRNLLQPKSNTRTHLYIYTIT